MSSEVAFQKICQLSDVPVNAGVCALIQGKQVAIFRTAEGGLYALANHDPFSGANVLSRGIVGTSGDVVKVASPIYKQQFNLATGQCLDDESVTIPSYAVREQDGDVYVSTTATTSVAEAV